MRALSSRTWFWVAQVGGWGAYASSLFLTFLPAMEPGRRVAVFINKELRAVVGIVLSLALLWLYRRVVPEPTVGGRAAVIALVASVLMGVAGYFAHAALMVGVGLQPSFAIFLEPTTLPRSILEFVFAFLVWSAAYFGVLVWKRSQEREREAVEARRLAQDALLGYLAIEQIRFEERLAIETHVEPAAEACAIPAFLIHPLLENAIKHGA